MGTTFQGVDWIAPFSFGDNEVYLTWHDPRRMQQWSLDGGETWNGPIEIMELAAAFGGVNRLVKDSAGVLHVLTAMTGGVFSAAWDGTQWGPRERIDDRPNDPHGQYMVVCQGNQLHVVYHDRIVQNSTGKFTIWYSSRQVNAPHLERRPFVPLTPQPTTPANSGTPSLPGVTRTFDAGRSGATDTSLPGSYTVVRSSNPMLIILMPVGLIAVLIVITFALSLLSRWRR